LFWQIYRSISGFRQAYRSDAPEKYVIASRKNEHYSLSYGNIMVPVAAILSV